MRELYNVMSESGSVPDLDQTEIWFHEDCICWMADIRIVGHVILGMQSIITVLQAVIAPIK